jgi:predicted anti-sigma-YlaC factor YlaD
MLVCDRIRGQVSVMLDGELSQLEQRMVGSHLERCADCREFERDVREFTMQIREAPLESPRVPVLVRRARRATLGAANVSVAAMLAVAALGVVAQLGSPGSRSSDVGAQLSTAALFSAGWKPERELATIDTHVPDPPGPFGAI